MVLSLLHLVVLHASNVKSYLHSHASMYVLFPFHASALHLYIADESNNYTLLLTAHTQSSVETVVFREGTTTLQQGGGYNIIARPCNIFILIINDISSIHETQYQCTFGQDTASTNLIIASKITFARKTCS